MGRITEIHEGIAQRARAASATPTTQVLKVTNGVCGVTHTATAGRTLCGRDAAGMLNLSKMGTWERIGWDTASKGACQRCSAAAAKLAAAPAVVHIRRTDEVNITECGLMTEYDAEITDAPISVPSGKGIAVFPDVETPAGPQCQACWHAFTAPAAVAPIALDTTPAGIFAAMMRANASDSAAPQSRLYGLLSDYLRRTLAATYGTVAAEHIYATAMQSGEFNEETIPYALESVQYSRTELTEMRDLRIGDTVDTDMGPVLLTRDNSARGLLSVRNFTGRILSVPSVPDHCTWVLRSNVADRRPVDHWTVQGTSTRLFRRYSA